MVDANDDICLTQVTQYSSQHAKPWPGTQIQLQERGRHSGYSGCKGQGGGAARIPEGHLNPQSKFPKLPRSNHGTLKFQNENPHLQNRCR